MKDLLKKITVISLLSSIITICIFTFALNNVLSTEYGEEAPDTVLPYDDVITGTMDDFSKRLIYIDGIGYQFCDDIMIFNPRNKLIKRENIEAATDVKVFVNKGCVRKIKVLRFAQ